MGISEWVWSRGKNISRPIKQPTVIKESSSFHCTVNVVLCNWLWFWCQQEVMSLCTKCHLEVWSSKAARRSIIFSPTVKGILLKGHVQGAANPDFSLEGKFTVSDVTLFHSVYVLAGSGVALMSNFEQLLRGVWRPETNEILNMSLWVFRLHFCAPDSVGCMTWIKKWNSFS